MGKQKDLFGEKIKEDWEEEWLEMPEYAHEDKTAEIQVIINFKCKEDIKKFSELIGQNITENTRSIWYPKAEIETLMDKRWTSE